MSSILVTPTNIGSILTVVVNGFNEPDLASFSILSSKSLYFITPFSREVPPRPVILNDIIGATLYFLQASKMS